METYQGQSAEEIRTAKLTRKLSERLKVYSLFEGIVEVEGTKVFVLGEKTGRIKISY